MSTKWHAAIPRPESGLTGRYFQLVNMGVWTHGDVDFQLVTSKSGRCEMEGNLAVGDLWVLRAASILVGAQGLPRVLH